MVGRQEELAQMRRWFANACQGSRQIVFVSGEPGIGKTSIVRMFLDSIALDGAVRVGRGQCIEQYGAGEPYMPVLESLTRLGQDPEGEPLIAILRRIAPTWLAQMPSLVSTEDLSRMQLETHGATRQRMLREMAEALDAISAESPLILFFEDLHWSDFSTLELISAIARRTEQARLMVIGTYRPVEMLTSDHPLRTVKEELELHQHCEELRLSLLSEGQVAAYLGLRFPDRELAGAFAALAPAILERTDGNPLFMVNVVDYLSTQGPPFDASKIQTPRSILQMIERNLDGLSPDERSILQAASIAGLEFSAAAVAAAVAQPTSEVESCCSGLARREQFVTADNVSIWPDGTIAATYEFRHALYRDALYERVPVGLRADLHRRIAKREEAGYGERAAEIAAELAHHYSCANDRITASDIFRWQAVELSHAAPQLKWSATTRPHLNSLQGCPTARKGIVSSSKFWRRWVRRSQALRAGHIRRRVES
jgi:predicted ATPase